MSSRPARSCLRSSITLSLLLAVMASHGAAAAGTDRMPPSLEGTWTLVAADDVDKDGKSTHAATDPKAKGLLIVDAEGRYSIQIFLVAQTSSVGEADPAKAAHLLSSHYGHVLLDPATHIVKFSIEAAYSPNWKPTGDYSPNWNGTEQLRPYTLSGDRLSYRVPASPGAKSTAISIWQRAPGRAMQGA